MKPRLALFTSNYPFRASWGEVMFLKPEVPHLTQVFDVTVIPLSTDGPNVDPHAALKIDGGLAEAWRACGGKAGKVRKALMSPTLYGEFARCLRAGRRPVLSQLAVFASQYQVAHEWLRTADLSNRFEVLYTYWCTPTTTALVSGASVPVVSRLHGGDLYRERQANGYVPSQSRTLGRLAKAVCISNHGLEYLKALGVPTGKLMLSRLGVPRQKAAKHSRDGVLRVVSCSSVIPIKRVSAILEALVRVCRLRPEQHVSWTHLGGGSQLEDLKNRASVRPDNLSIRLEGQLSNQGVLDYYRSQPVDLFLHASETEGLPVCIQEAQSFGVPVASTDVGGVPEIVGPEVGYLVPVDDPVTGLSGAVQAFLSSTDSERRRMRENARERQRLHFDSDTNHQRFAEALLQLVQLSPPVSSGSGVI